ncbi:S8 family peptidase [Allomuricauda sp. F6463D]|uniref:S8 family peptidase n=1 Tax=Allomuricauda sp. F6463D TaxID=2926409 RepID=UPI001FF35005|nr:S8 family serine peptidase [Muricauda sp. F6463D]MCK0159586.1 S8 family serine peptidase [Muricauda sp. F6463D]
MKQSKLPVILGAILLFSSFIVSSQQSQWGGKVQTEIENVWVDSAYDPADGTQSVVVWFKDQYLENADSYLKKTKEFKGRKRLELRSEVTSTLKEISNMAFGKVESKLKAMEQSGVLTNINQHWIISGFSCNVAPEGIAALKKLENVAFIFKKQPSIVPKGNNMGPEYLESIPVSNFNPKEVESYPWNIEKIRAPEVWDEFGITGKGVLNVVHDSGFKLDIPPLASNIYTNKGEIPGNGIDDDGNGYIDDYHGFHFDQGKANLNEPNIRRATNIHGNLCAAMIVGTYETGTKKAIGVAPGANWAPLIGVNHIEDAIEWAIEQGADTYSMSFSHPNLGEYRTHWRKILEQGTLCGVVFISGAGNFAAGNSFAPIPVQMRNPEDIPNAVLGVAGIGEDGQRPAFSSQGPVEWNTAYYREGLVNKPDFTTINYKVPCVDPEGKLLNMASGNSLAGPHTAGIVSLMLSANPDLLPWEIKSILLSIAEDIGDPGFDYQSGHGFINAYDAVNAVINPKSK